MLLPPAVAGALPGVMPLAEPLLGEHRTVSVHLISCRRLPLPTKPLQTVPMGSGDAAGSHAACDLRPVSLLFRKHTFSVADIPLRRMRAAGRQAAC